MIKFTVSVLTYCALSHAKTCVESILRHSSDYRLILTANGSPEAAAYFHWVAEHNPNVTVIINPTNEGFIEPSRKAFALCDTPYFVLLNDDTQVPAGWLQTLELPFLQHASAVLSGPHKSCSALKPNFDGDHGALEYLEGSCLCCKAEIVRKHGLFSNYLIGAYAEDSDLSLRMRQLGYTLHQVPLDVKHVRFATSRHVPEAKMWLERNKAVLQKRWSHYLNVRRFDYPLVLRRTGACGDVLLLTPIIRTLKQQMPLSPIFVETAVPDVFRGNQNVQKAATRIPTFKTEQRFDFDMAYENRPGTHILDAYAQVAGVQPETRSLDLFTLDSERHFKHIQNGSKWCAIHTGPSWKGKTWNYPNFVTLCEWLRTQNYKIAHVGHLDGPTPSDLDIRGKTTIQQLAGFLKGCALFVGIDSFVAHAAAAMRVKSVVLFGITSPDYILTDTINAVSVTADPSHPSAGARHKSTGQTFTDCAENPMDTITLKQVAEAVQRVTA